MRKALSVLAVMFLLGAGVPAMAECPMEKSGCPQSDNCPMKQGRGMACQKCGEMEESHQCPIIGMLMKKAHFLLCNKEAIGLTDEQVKTINGIKIDAKRAAIRDTADMEIMMLDMKAKLMEDKVDVEGLSAMVDQGMSGMAKNAKASIQNYAKLKSVLTPEQMAKAKEIWKKK